MPRPRNALLRRYRRGLDRIGPGQFAVLVLLGLACVCLVSDRSGLSEGAQQKNATSYRPGIDFYEAERRAAERANQGDD